MTTQASHGVDPTPEINAADNKGAAPQAAAPAASAPADPTQGGKTLPIGGADGQPGIYNPNNTIPAHLLGQDNNGTIDKLLAAYTGARAEIAKGKPEPLKAADIKFEWGDKMKGVVAADDPAVSLFTTIAADAGFSQQQLAAIPKFFEAAAEKGLIEKPFDSKAMLASLAPADYQGTPDQKEQRGAQRLNAADAWIKQLAPAHGFDDGMKQELRLLTTSVDGVRILEKFMTSGMNPSISPGGGQQAQAITKADLDARTADPRNDSTRHDKYDPAFAEETRRLFKQLYPG